MLLGQDTAANEKPGQGPQGTINRMLSSLRSTEVRLSAWVVQSGEEDY